MAEMPRRMSPPLRPTMMKAKVETAPMKPRSIREKKSWRSVRETAMRKKPPPWSIWVATYERLGFFSPKMRAENGAMNMDRGRAQSPRPRADAIASAPRRGGAAKREPCGDPGARGHDRDDEHPESGAGATTTGFVHGDE